MYPGRRTIKIGKFEFPEPIYWAAMRAKEEEERRLQRGAEAYSEKARTETKDGQITFRISNTDIAKLKMLAHGKNLRYQAYLRGILRQEIDREIERQEALKAATARRRGRRPS